MNKGTKVKKDNNISAEKEKLSLKEKESKKERQKKENKELKIEKKKQKLERKIETKAQNKFFWKYLSKQKTRLFIFLFANFLRTILSICKTIAMAQSITQVALQNYETAFYYMLISAIIVLINRIAFLISSLAQIKMANELTFSMKNDMTKQAFKINSQTYSNIDTGAFNTRIIANTSSLFTYFNAIVLNINFAFYYIGVLVYVLFLNFYISFLLIIAIIIAIVIEYFRLKVFKKSKKMAHIYSEKVQSLTTESLLSEKDVKSLNLEDRLFNEIYNVNKKQKLHNIKRTKTNLLYLNARNILLDIFYYLILLAGIYMIDTTMIALSVYMIIYSNQGNIYSIASTTGTIAENIVEIRVILTRLMEFCDDEVFAIEKFGDVKLDNIKGKIEFKNVGYSYFEISKKEKNLKDRKILSESKVFKDLSFVIQPNTTVAFAGTSGSGKTTIMNLISKMYEAKSGKIFIDDININSLDKQTLRNTFSLVNQFAYIFDMTIRENLLLVKSDATDNEIEKVLKDSALLDFVNSLPNRLDTNVGESGVKLSGGQKQRLAIARAFLSNKKILLFDESTSSLDNIAQQTIKSSIDKLKGSGTIIIVAHRLSTIKNVDVIYFLENGNIVDSGTFDELFDKNEKFKNMFMIENLNEKLLKDKEKLQTKIKPKSKKNKSKNNLI